MTNIIVPELRSYDAVQELIRQQHEIYWVEREKSLPQFKAENIHFEHDPLWKYRLMSVQSAHDGNCSLWVVAKYAFVAAGAAPYVLRMFV